ncbi:dynein light chain Tctex-type 5 isoform X2 [Neofelis nebulosa]|uniref:dynein light chain Tctex-type 5 isoform X2 n=1 Tax=Neofelis nebulosa TaxID=61452 RepID=UPI00272C659E|nr:dynein light chain Tctex-type 5 isoform X2 [Neofelis nebulosa]
MMMSDIAKDRMAHSVKKRGSMSSLSGQEFWQKELHRCTKNSMSTVSYMDEPSQRDDASCLTVQMENTYQLGEETSERREGVTTTCVLQPMRSQVQVHLLLYGLPLLHDQQPPRYLLHAINKKHTNKNNPCVCPAKLISKEGSGEI